jgi:hypothetical protein|tara:strand:- start:19 stop:390 length:372 start_codon:yes stop_codon:yes gene_type:complete
VDNNQRGTFAEYLFATKCLEKGYNVSFPLMDSSVYDCIIDTGKRLLKVQVKSTIKTPEKNRNTIQAHLENSKSSYTKESVDFFAVYVKHYDGFFIFKNKGTMQTIRLSLKGRNKIYFNNFVFE